MPEQEKKIVFNLPKPVESAQECLPHAAMSLGAPANVSRMISRLIIERTGLMWTLYRLDEGGGFVGDTTHISLEDALHQANRECGPLPEPEAK